jgi:hypothetical protein
MRQKDAGTLKILCNEELHNLHSSSDVCDMFKPRRMERVGDMTNGGD